MNQRSPFQPADLDELDDRLLDRALAVSTMAAVAAGERWPEIIGLRHDVDNVIEPAVEFAKWEAERGYRASFYVLHTSSYWGQKSLLRKSLEMIAECGHEIGIHNNALAAAVVTGRDPAHILYEAVEELRGYGFDVRGTVAHGDNRCYGQDGKVRFVNDELFKECARPEMGDPDRTVAGMRIEPVPLAYFELEYDANWLGRGSYLSDSGGAWSRPFAEVADGFPFAGQLHMLVHPDWWGEAFVSQEIAA